MYRGGFLHFLHQWKQEKILYRGNTKFATLPQLSLHYLRKLMLYAINGKNESKWIVFRVCAQNVHPLLALRLPNDLSIGRQHCQWSAARVRSRGFADAAEVHHDVWCDAIM